ncbi:hypothetical protein ACOSQ2_029623 [Xanthoceras sorbifolium]
MGVPMAINKFKIINTGISTQNRWRKRPKGGGSWEPLIMIDTNVFATANAPSWTKVSLIRQQTPSDSIKGSINAWRLCTVTQVEELKSIIRLLPIWTSGIVFSAVYSQMGTLFVLQGTGPRESCPIFARIHIAFSSISAHHQTHHSAPKSFSLSLYSTTGELLK